LLERFHARATPLAPSGEPILPNVHDDRQTVKTTYIIVSGLTA
jgi:hypothetical protein